MGAEWNERLVAAVGRPTGVRSPYLWAAHHLRETPEVAAAHRAGRLGFGTIETWLLWSLSRDRIYVATSTNATSAGAYVLAEHDYEYDVDQRAGLPARSAARSCDRTPTTSGVTNAELLGIEMPILAPRPATSTPAPSVWAASTRARRCACTARAASSTS